MSSSEVFVCSLYSQLKLSDVNKARYEMFCSKGCSTSQQPPCHDVLHLHIKHANYQAAVWSSALCGHPALPSPHGHGWIINYSAAKQDPNRSIVWIKQLPALQQLLELISHSCKTGCKSRQCSCLSNSLKCTDVCNCSCDYLG